jgi:hypothetical protein
MFIANAALENSDNDPEWQFYFMACLYGYGVLSPAYRVAELCFKGLLAIAVETGKMPTARARYLLEELTQRGEHHQPWNTYSGIRLNLNAGDLEERSGTVEDLASRLESAVVFETNDADINEGDLLFDELINMGGS